jgi:hypothetical protein
MKAVTEFSNFKLAQGLKAKNELATGGKTPEEIEIGLGEAMKLEGEKLKYFVNALEIATPQMEKLTRVVIMSLNEGEAAPAKATQIDSFVYVPEFLAPPKAPAEKTDGGRGGRGGRGGGGGGKPGGGKGNSPKSSPWGLSPEEIEAKKQASKNAAAKNK